jgi:hypothetical protein
MLFICKNCPQYGPEEIIVDKSPKCVRCGKPMVRATESYKGIWLSPRFVIYRMESIVETHGTREAKSSRRFKHEREAWTTAIWALGLEEMHGRDYWVEIETQESTPDTKVHRLDQSNGHNRIETYNVEVVDWEEHVDDLVQIVQQKCARAYPPYFWLVILGRSGKTVDLNTVTEGMRGLHVPFAEIWMVGRTLENPNKVRTVRLFPSGADVLFVLKDALRRSERQADTMRPQHRGTGTELRSLGDIYLPIPR